MRYASIRQAPVFGATTQEGVEAGVGVELIRLKNTYAVVADSWWQAESQLRQLDLKWTSTDHDNMDQETIYRKLHDALDESNVEVNGDKEYGSGDANNSIESAAETIEATYQVPYLAHATMEPLNCTGWIHDGLCEVWTGSQNPLGLRAEVASALDYDDEQVVVHNQLLGGGFGRRASSDYGVITALVAAQVNHPVS